MHGDWNMAGANYFKLPCELFWGGLPMAECQLACHHFRGKSNQATNQDGKVLGLLALSPFSSRVLLKTSVLIGSILYRFAYAFTRESRRTWLFIRRCAGFSSAEPFHLLILSSSSLEEEMEEKENCLQDQ